MRGKCDNKEGDLGCTLEFKDLRERVTLRRLRFVL